MIIFDQKPLTVTWHSQYGHRRAFHEFSINAIEEESRCSSSVEETVEQNAEKDQTLCHKSINSHRTDQHSHTLTDSSKRLEERPKTKEMECARVEGKPDPLVHSDRSSSCLELSCAHTNNNSRCRRYCRCCCCFTCNKNVLEITYSKLMSLIKFTCRSTIIWMILSLFPSHSPVARPKVIRQF